VYFTPFWQEKRFFAELIKYQGVCTLELVIRKICQFLSLGVISLFLFANSAQASVLYFKPLGGNITPNVVFPVEIHLSSEPSESITSTSVYFNYPADKLEIVSVKAGSSFPVNLGNSYSNGTFAMTRNNINGVTGDVVVATVGFKAKMANTWAELTFVDGIKAALADNTETLDMDWTKKNIARFNIKEGDINRAPVSDGQGGTLDELPTAGLLDNTLVLLGTGTGLIFFSGLGLWKSKKISLNKNSTL
jgi:hypothetical protein